VIQLDGIWVTITEQAKWWCLIGAIVRVMNARAKEGDLGSIRLWIENGKEKREIVDWQIAESEKHEEWKVLLDRLVERGAKARMGSRPSSVTDAVVWAEQWNSCMQECGRSRCIFHKLKNVKTSAEPNSQGRIIKSKEHDARSTGCLSG